jgi:hypothetical protein
MSSCCVCIFVHRLHEKNRLWRGLPLSILPAPDRDTSVLPGEAEAGSEVLGREFQFSADGEDLGGSHCGFSAKSMTSVGTLRLD